MSCGFSGCSVGCRPRNTMKFFPIFLILALLPPSAFSADSRLYVNELKAPASRKDLEAIQKSVAEALPKARAATVGIEIKDGSGSGVIISSDGLVLTAAHVASGVRKKVTVVLEDGTKLKAETLGLVPGSVILIMAASFPATSPRVSAFSLVPSSSTTVTFFLTPDATWAAVSTRPSEEIITPLPEPSLISMPTVAARALGSASATDF